MKQPRRIRGERLRDAATAAGYTSETIAELLGYSGGGVRGWWVGKTEPPLDALIRYAELVGRSVEYLLTGEERRSDQPPAEEIVSALEAFRRLWQSAVEAGEEPASAVDRLLGGDEFIAPADRKRLTDEAAAIREFFASGNGKEWAKLGDDQRRVISELIRMLGQPRRRGVDPPE